MENNLPPQIVMSQMIFGYANAKAIHVAAKLNIADLLAEHGPMDSSELARRTGADEESISTCPQGGKVQKPVWCQGREIC